MTLNILTSIIDHLFDVSLYFDENEKNNEHAQQENLKNIYIERVQRNKKR